MLVLLLTACAGNKAMVLPVHTDQTEQLSVQLQTTFQGAKGVSVIRIADSVQLILPSDNLFAVGKSTLNNDPTLLSKVSEALRSYPNAKIQVECLTDRTGSVNNNMLLSEQRAAHVRRLMIDQGVDSEAVTALGYGEAFPVASNRTLKGQALNRRIVLTISTDPTSSKKQ
jgi:outer membrane protein OmpA-like peptidoglycan-associated protein